MPDEQMLRIANEIATRIKPYLVCLCGGEPTLRYDLCVKIAKLLTSHGIAVNMVSNGLLLNKEKVSTLFSSGIRNIQISLDSYREEIVDMFRRTKGAYKAATSAIETILDLGRTPGVACIPTQLNYRDLPGLAKYLHNLGIPERKL